MDPVVNKLTTTLPDSSSPETGGQSGKTGASKFAKVRSQLKDSSGSEASPAHSSVVNGDLSADRVQQTAATAPDRVSQNLETSQHYLVRLRERIEATPSTSSMQGLQSRLTSIEHQYTRLDSAVKAMLANASPQQWIALQQQVYSMNENIGVLSKMVGQAASGVKSILQTQV
jgi:hypothetical protein